MAGKSWVTTTPKGQANWVYDAVKHMTVFKAKTMENPFVSKEWLDDMMSQYQGSFLMQEIYGEFVKFEGLVYPQFDQSIHIQHREMTEFVEFGMGIDEGYINPQAILNIYKDHDGNYHIAEEYYETGKLQTQIVEEAVRMAHGKNPTVVVDASARGLIGALRNAGLDAKSYQSRVLDGINTIQNMLAVSGNGKPKLTVDPSCVKTIMEFETYCWKEDKDEVVKENDHAMDALRYYIMGRGTAINTKATITNYTK